MKAWVLHDIDNFRIENANMPTVAEDEVLVEVKAAGICGSDIPRIYRTGAYSYPLIPGHEFSGVVTETGKRVGVFPLIPCKKCLPCQKKQYEMCRNYSYLGSRRDGGFAEYVSVPRDNLIELPDEVSFEEAAMLEPMAVAVHAMKRIMPKETDTVAIYGLGTIGMLLLMFLMEAGITNVYIIGNKDFQKETVLKMGIAEENYCNSKLQNVSSWIMERTNQAGIDVFFECVGRNEVVTQVVELTAPAGRICCVGNPYSDMTFEKSVYWKILRNQLTITGTWNSSFPEDWEYVLKKLASGQISSEELISHKYSIDDIERGFHIMRDKTEDYIKIMMKKS